mgnify:CR=1 FL=1
MVLSIDVHLGSRGGRTRTPRWRALIGDTQMGLQLIDYDESLEWLTASQLLDDSASMLNHEQATAKCVFSERMCPYTTE